MKENQKKNRLKNINKEVLVNKNILLAIGSRLLNETASII